MVLMIDNYDSFTYNLVQYLGELGAELEVHRSRKIGLDALDALKPERIVISPRALHTERGRHIQPCDTTLRRQSPDLRGLPWASVHRRRIRG